MLSGWYSEQGFAIQKYCQFWYVCIWKCVTLAFQLCWSLHPIFYESTPTAPTAVTVWFERPQQMTSDMKAVSCLGENKVCWASPGPYIWWILLGFWQDVNFALSRSMLFGKPAASLKKVGAIHAAMQLGAKISQTQPPTSKPMVHLEWDCS